MGFKIHNNQHFRYLVKACLIIGVFILLMDLFSLIYYSNEANWLNALKTIPIDFGVAAIWVLFGSPIFLLVSLISRNSARVFIVFFGLVLILMDIILNRYFSVSKVQLGSDLFGYSIDEIQMIVQNSTDIDWFSFLPPFFAIFAYIFAFFIINIKSKQAPGLGLFFLFSILFLILNALFSKPTHTNLTYFLKDSYGYFLSGKKAESKKWDTPNPYPLIRVNSIAEDVLGKNMNLGSEKPNIVLILVEGLGRDFSGIDAEYPGFTPFLDSLSNNSLTWTNFMSNAGRSFGALPSILGSLPFGKKGFLELEKLPDHISLISELKKAGYQTSYFEGGNADFDRKLKYLNHEGMEKIIDENSFGSGYKKVAAENGFSWGYPDSEIFRKTLTELKPAPKPRFDMILTISNHEPFIFDRKEHYLKMANEILSKGKFEEKKLEEINKNKDVFAALLYTDDCIRNFINQYKISPNFANTIFLITGDHRLIPVNQKNEICRFHVPLIVYSPMISRPQVFKGISSHFDIMPSILALISNKYGFKMPEKVHWLGTGLSSASTFHNDKDIPFTRYKGTIKDYITGDYFISDNVVFKLGDNLITEETARTKETRMAISKFEYFQQVNSYVTQNNKIIPPEMVQNKPKERILTEAEIDVVNKYIGKNIDTDRFMIARDLAFKKNYKEALILCDYIINDSPNNFDCRTLKGRIMAWMGDYEKAEVELKAIIERSPTYSDAYSALMDIYWWSNRPDKARSLMIKAKNNNAGKTEFLNDLKIAMKRFNN